MPLVTPAEVNDALSRVYARPEFAERTTPALLQRVAELWSAFWTWVWSLLPQFNLGLGATALAWIVVALLGLVAVWALVRLLGGRIMPTRGSGAAAGARAAPAGHAAPKAAHWEAAARDAATQGRFRDAAHALYLATVLRLEERGALRYHAGKTPGDYRREVRADPAASGPFDRFVRRFLPVAFGADEPATHHFDDLRNAATELGVRA
jgi:hypothetical protein